MVTACHLQITTYIILPSRSRHTRVRIIGYGAIIILSRPSRPSRPPSALRAPFLSFFPLHQIFFFNFQALKTHIKEKSTKWILDKKMRLYLMLELLIVFIRITEAPPPPPPSFVWRLCLAGYQRLNPDPSALKKKRLLIKRVSWDAFLCIT